MKTFRVPSKLRTQLTPLFYRLISSITVVSRKQLKRLCFAVVFSVYHPPEPFRMPPETLFLFWSKP